MTLTDTAVSALGAAGDPAAIRRAVADLGPEHLEDALDVLGMPEERRRAVRGACAGAALRVGELAIGGADLIREGIVDRGPAIGAMLMDLLEVVLERPELNERRHLLAEARRRASAE
jgi:hypothetical protein